MQSKAGLYERTITFFINAAIAYYIFSVLLGQSVPTGEIQSIWFISALSYWFLTLLTANWFLTPKDGIINGLTAAILLLNIQFKADSPLFQSLENLRLISLGLCLAVSTFSTIALVLHEKNERSPSAKSAFRLVGFIGRGELLFSPPAIISLIVAYQHSFQTLAWMTLLWIAITNVKPIETLVAVVRIYKEDWRSQNRQPTLGVIDRIDSPNLVRVKLNSKDIWKPNQLLTAMMPDGEKCHLISLFSQVQGSEVVGSALKVGQSNENNNLPNGHVCLSLSQDPKGTFIEKVSGSKTAKLVGFIVENSNIGVITFEVAASSELGEGDVIYTRISGNNIFYQIIGAETYEESFDQNPRGTHRVKAAQLGVFDKSEGFKKFNWLPAMNTPVFAAKDIGFEQEDLIRKEIELGLVPSTNIKGVGILDDIIEYHTAILGVTGTGKTELALDIVKEAVKNGTKVFCVDFTGDYRRRLNSLNPYLPTPNADQVGPLERLIFEAETRGFQGAHQREQAERRFDAIRVETEQQVAAFLGNNHNDLSILELTDITNSNVSLRITELYLSAIMNWAKNNRRQRQVLLCLEEAHTIVPETFQSGNSGGTKRVVERIGQIALQGRKYQVGLLVISQRTALVSKTILSQCNTFFTHALIDQTSLGFLESVYSSQHTKLIPNLGRFEFLASGKGLKSERPIVLRREFDQTKLDESRAVAADGNGADINTEDPVERAEPRGPDPSVTQT